MQSRIQYNVINGTKPGGHFTNLAGLLFLTNFVGPFRARLSYQIKALTYIGMSPTLGWKIAFRTTRL